MWTQGCGRWQGYASICGMQGGEGVVLQEGRGVSAMLCGEGDASAEP